MHMDFLKSLRIVYYIQAIDYTPSFQILTHLSVESAENLSLASAETKSPGCVRKTKVEVNHFSLSSITL